MARREPCQIEYSILTVTEVHIVDVSTPYEHLYVHSGISYIGQTASSYHNPPHMMMHHCGGLLF